MVEGFVGLAEHWNEVTGANCNYSPNERKKNTTAPSLTVWTGLLHLLHHALAAALQPQNLVLQPIGAAHRNRRAQRLDFVLHARQAQAIVLQLDAQALLAQQLAMDDVGCRREMKQTRRG